MLKKVLVTEPIHEAGLSRLAEEVEVVRLDGQSIDDLIGGVDGVVVRILKMPAALIDRASRLKVIGKHGIGVDNIDVAAATRRGIPVVFTPGGNEEAVAEHALTLILALARRLQDMRQALRDGRFSAIRGEVTSIDLKGRALGLIGVGRIGSRLGEICRLGFGMRVLAYDPYVTPERAAALGVELATLDEVLAGADFISVHTPLTPETRGLIGDRTLGLMKPTAYVVNCARGGIVDERALLAALREKRIAGAGLDVFASEPPDLNDPTIAALFARDDVVVSPHVAGGSGDALEAIALMVAEEVLQVLRGERPRHAVNPAVFG